MDATAMKKKSLRTSLRVNGHIFGVVGCGVVGGTFADYFDEHGFDVVRYDPVKYPNGAFADLLTCDYTVICVPTQPWPDGSQDDSAVQSTIYKLFELGYAGAIVIKSTTLPTNIAKYEEACQRGKIIANPEFLTERTAVEDFRSQPLIVLGSNKSSAALNNLVDIYRDCWPGAELRVTTARAAMMMKYMTNSFFATKVALMNEFYRLWESVGGDHNEERWEELVDIFKLDKRVHPMHLSVPGPDGKFGFGGKCFPKDVAALRYTMQQHNTPNNVLVGAEATNSMVRDR